MTDYITVESFSARHGITTSTNLARIGEHVTAASRRVDAITGRQFGPHSGAATVRYFSSTGCHMADIDDAYEITLVDVDGDDDGTFETSWAATDYETDPSNGIGPDGQPGWPTFRLRAVGSKTFPSYGHRRCVKVTAKWGWAAVPADVVEATYLLAHRYYFEVSVPSGIVSPGADFGLPGVGLRKPYTAEDLLAPFTRSDKAIGVTG